MSIINRQSISVGVVAAMLIACGPPDVPVAPAASKLSAAAAHPGNAGGNKLVKVMTQNLYLGAELGPAMQPDLSPLAFMQATTAVWQMVNRNDFGLRAQAIAAEIAAERPELVGLQEAYTWKYRDAADAPADEVVVYDYVPQLLAALAARGVVYRAVASVTLFDFEAPIIKSLDPFAIAFVHTTDHGVILAREDVATARGEGHVYQAALPLSVQGQSLSIPRGWVRVDVKHQGEWFTFVSTHLEAYHWYVRWLQAQELAAAVSAIPGRVVMLGDLNSDPAYADARQRLAYETLVGAGLGDSWSALHPDDPGYTSPYAEDLTIEAITLGERIDHVLLKGPETPLAAGVVGAQVSDRVCGTNALGEAVCLWPSDHAGVWATIRLEDSMFQALQ